MPESLQQAAKNDIAIPPPVVPERAPKFDGNSTTHFQIRMSRAPAWFCSLLASNSREKMRLRDELVLIKGAWPLLMKQRNGGKWTPEEKQELRAMIRSASSVSPYLFIWAVPGSVILLPFLAWYLDRKRKNRDAGSPD
jgi:hypothetical protein